MKIPIKKIQKKCARIWKRRARSSSGYKIHFRACVRKAVKKAKRSRR